MNAFQHRRTQRRIASVKRRARSELRADEWAELDYWKRDDLTLGSPTQNIMRIDASSLSVEEFRKNYESQSVPMILTGLTDDWPAHEKWTLTRLTRKYRNQKFKCGEDDEGQSVKLKMKYYADYMSSTCDDSPLYIFDSSFGERKKTKRLLDDYAVPDLFRDDLFRYALERRRPPYRWLVIGPARSGTGIHVDPLGTSAWNALIHGHKRWCLFRPSVPKYVLKPTVAESGKHPEEAITWFSTVYKRVCSPEWPSEFAPIEVVQQPGEIMFVPSGWWHVVLNLDSTVAVTQNFCSSANLPFVWNKTVRGRPKFSKHWFRVLRKYRPELLSVIKDAADINDQVESSSSDSSSSSSSSSDHSSDNDEEHRAIFGNGDHPRFTGHWCSSPRSLKRRLEVMEQDAQHCVQECANKIRRSPM